MYVSGRGCLGDWPPTETLYAESLTELPWLAVSHVLSQPRTGEIKSVLCNSTGTGSLEVCLWSPLDFTPWAFSPC